MKEGKKNKTISVLPDIDFWTFSSFHRQKIISASQSVRTLTDYTGNKQTNRDKKLYIGFDIRKKLIMKPQPYFKR